jgi:hypothetical protein
VGLYTLVVLFLLRDVLFRGDRIISGDGFDLSAGFLPWSVLTRMELGHGRLPLWNPFTFSGAPFFGNFQTALLYPTTWLQLVLPAAPAFNLSFAFHLILAGTFSYGFCRARGRSFWAAFYGGAAFLLSGPYLLHIFPGHLTFVVVTTWTPFLFLVAERLLKGPTLAWVSGGAAAVGLQLVGGHPQPAYVGALFATSYLVLESSRATTTRSRLLGAWVGMYSWGALLAAPALVAGAQAARESWRAGGTSFDFAASLSLPPENLLSLVVPGLLGDNTHVEYAGAEFLWEACLFVGVVSLIFGVMGARSEGTGKRALLVLSAASLVLALGRYTPVYWICFHALPGFDSLRVPARFGAVFALLMATLASDGVDVLLSGKPHGRRLPAAVFLLSLSSAAVAALVLRAAGAGAAGAWGRLLSYLQATRHVYLNRGSSHPSEFVTESAQFAASELGTLALVLLAASLLLLARAGARGIGRKALVLLGGLELLHFAGRTVTWMSLPIDYPSTWAAAASALPSDARVFDPTHFTANQSMLLGVQSMSGYDPMVPKRYGQFLYALDGRDPDSFVGKLGLGGPSKAFALLRCQAFFAPGGGVIPLSGALPRAFFVRSFELATGRDDAIRRFASAGFDPSRGVILERSPIPSPAPNGTGGTVSLVDLTTDRVEVTAELAEPAILVMTDAFSSAFQVTAMPDSAAREYSLLAADWIVRAVPLGPGHHHFELEHRPRGMTASFVSSVVAAVLWCASWVVAIRRRPRVSPRPMG